MENKRVIRSKAEAGDPKAIVKWATNTYNGDNYAAGRKLAETFGEETANQYTELFRRHMNRRAATEPSTPEHLGVGSTGIEPPPPGKQRLHSGIFPQNEALIKHVIIDLFGKSEPSS